MRLRKTVLALALVTMPAVALAAPAGAESGAQTFRLFFVGSFVAGASNAGPVFASGPITASGTAVNSGFVVQPDGSFVGNNQLQFEDGTIFVDFAGQLDSFEFDPRTCVTRIQGHGTWEVGDASGAYEGTTGGGTFTNDVTLIARPLRGGGCSTQTTEVSRITLEGEIDTGAAAAA
jgi:hypothetical protein